MKILNKRFFLILIPICIMYISPGCSIEEPDRYYDENVDSYVVGILRIDQITPGQHIAGSRTIGLNFDSLSVPVKKAVIYIDDKELTELTKKPYNFVLSASALTAGNHTIKVYVIADKNGIYSGFDIPQLLYAIPFVFDPANPSPVYFEKVEWSDGHPVIYWKPNNDKNFYSYILKCWNTRTKVEYYDTVYNQNTVSFTDYKAEFSYGTEILRYSISVSNGYTQSAVKDTAISTGAVYSFPETAYPMVNPSYNIFYTLDIRNLIMTASSITGNNLLHNAWITNPYSWTYYDAGYALSSNNKKLYLACRNSNPNLGGMLYIYDSQTLQVEKTLPTGSYGVSRVAVAGERIYMAGDSSLIAIMDSSGGTSGIYNSLSLPIAGIYKVIASPDNSRLYVFGLSHYAIIDITNMRMNLQKMVPGFTYYADPYCVLNGDKIFITENENTIAELSSINLEVIGRITLDNGFRITGMCSSGNGLFISAVDKNQSENGIVYKYSVDNLLQQKTFSFLGTPSRILFSGNGKDILTYLGRPYYTGRWLMISGSN